MTGSKRINAWACLCVLLWISLLGFSFGSLAQDLGGRNLTIDNGSRRLALVLGNDAYQKVGALKNARNDALLMATTLKKAGFEVTQASDLGRDLMWKSIDNFRGRINKGDEVVFYYAGHGVQINSNQLLLPVDISAESDGQVQRDAVSLVDIQDALKDARFALLVIDACRDNPFPKAGGRSIGGGVRGLLAPDPVTGQVIVMSAGRNQKALDNVPGETRSNGLFTWELAQAMQAPGVEIRTALEQVKDRVDDKAKSVGHDQRPSMVSDLRGSFYFFGSDPGRVQGADSGGDPDLEAWTAANRSNSVIGYETYLEAYPKGRYIIAARIALNAIKASATKTPAPSKSSPVASQDPEAQFWNEVKSSGAREYLDAYVKQYPKGKYLALARIELKKLNDQDKAERGRQIGQRSQEEQVSWDSAKIAGTQDAYANYLGSYPVGRYAALAQAAQQKIQRESAVSQRQEAQRVVDQQRKQREDSERESREMRPGKVFKDCDACPAMVVIPAGSFMMGRNDGPPEEKLAHKVAIKGFAMGKTEVTQEQWMAMMGSNPSSFKPCGSTCPVENLSWDDAQTFIQKLNAKTGKSYRLPSESEWEYACQAGVKQTYCGADNLDSVAVYGRKSGITTLPVANKQANAWGLFDMSGNVWEWTQDCWNDGYYGVPSDGSASMSGNCDFHIQRGGSWAGDAVDARITTRNRVAALSHRSVSGFRLARTLP